MRLRDELGAAPGPAVQALHSRAARRPGRRGPPRRRARRAQARQRRVRRAGRARSRDPEDLRAAHARLREVFEGFGGAVARPGRSAVFGVPAAHEDDPERAVRAALHACERGLAARAGVATGEAIVSGDGTATGAVTGAAERLQRAAARGATLADEATVRRRAARRLRARAAGLAARAAPPRASGARRSSAARTSSRRSRRCTPRVVAERRPHLVTIVGPGRDRQDPARGRADRPRGGTDRLPRPLPAPTARASRGGRCGRSCGARPASGSTTARPPRRPSSRARRALVGDEVERVTAALAASAGIALAGPSGRSRRRSRWPRRSASPGRACSAHSRPPVVVIEDLHWAEAPLLEMVEAIVGRCDGPLLLVATARPELAEARPGWGYRPGMSQVVLQPLSDAETRRARRRAAAGARRRRSRRRVARKAEGNPFFAEELARHLEADGEPREIPNTVRALLAARIDALPADERRVLRHAAVVGRTFWAPALEPTSARRRRCARSRRAGSSSRAPDRALPGHTELAFVHGLTREVAYHSIPRADRCRTHAAVARWIEGPRGRPARGVRRAARPPLRGRRPPGGRGARVAGRPDEREAVRAAAVRALVDAGDAARRRMAVDQARRASPTARWRWRDDARAARGAGAARAAASTPRSAATTRSPPTSRRSPSPRGSATAPPRRGCAASRSCSARATPARSAAGLGRPGGRARRGRARGATATSRRASPTGALRVGRSWGMRRWRAHGLTRDYSIERRQARRGARGRDRRGDPLLAAAGGRARGPHVALVRRGPPATPPRSASAISTPPRSSPTASRRTRA